ncbi:hypothetical protein CLOSBL3_12108 [Clostridiaceae bacterium BL-3]|nr:hypothetical protein CLOSBL3_12108 [Clostridiaceae bacterium BL-3]
MCNVCEFTIVLINMLKRYIQNENLSYNVDIE